MNTYCLGKRSKCVSQGDIQQGEWVMTHRIFGIMGRSIGLLVLFSALILPGADAQGPTGIPSELLRWQDWVLHEHESELCPCRFNDSTVSRCQWPTRLRLDITSDGAEFEQSWYVFAPGWVTLPGSAATWPDGVTLDGQPAVVVQQDKAPAVWVPVGVHRMRGRFFWTQTPETIALPPALGLLNLTRNGLPVNTPQLTEQNQLWLGRQRPDPTGENAAGVKIFRLIRDTIPLQVVTLVRVDVSGQGRELLLQGVLPEGGIPMALESPLPARLNADNQLILQARPGRWEIQISARLSGPRTRIEAGPLPYGDEIWSFQAHHQLRQVEILNVKAIEPSQTELPPAWRQFPAYVLTAGNIFTLKEIRRGNANPPPDQLSLKRTWWLDFSGKGFTIHDAISGTLSRQWSLAMNPPVQLGRVTVNGQDQMITAQGEGKKAGVELRAGRLSMLADATMEKKADPIQVVGWDHDFKQVHGQLHLPPGWQLLTTSGIDAVSDSWLQRWSLLDLFLALIIALATFKLRGWPWGLTALLLMVLIFQEPGAPRLVWLHLLAVAALLPLLPRGWIKRGVVLWGLVALVVLMVQALPFAVDQVRWGFFPQLAPHFADDRFSKAQVDTIQSFEKAPLPMAEKESRPTMSSVKKQRVQLAPPAPQGSLAQQDQDALIPTGPGLPQWHWRTIDLTWNGPLTKTQTMRLYLLSPLVNLTLALVRVILLIGFLTGFIDWRPWVQKLRASLKVGPALALLVIMALPAAGLRADECGAGFPPPALLDQLRQRLLEKPDCFPACADISRMEISLSDDQIQVRLKVHAATQTAVPLPVNHNDWTPVQVLMDNAPTSGLAREAGGQLWALVPEGVHTIVLTGHTNQKDMVQMPLYLKPHAVSVTAPDWEVRGIGADGRVSATLQLMRVHGQQLEDPNGQEEENRPSPGFAPFFHVTHHLQLGLTWLMTTHVQRLTPPGNPAVLSIPLPEGASVTTPDIQTQQGNALVHMTPDQQVRSYTATLPIGTKIQLTAPRAVPWVETWRLDAATIWHCDISGIAPVQHQNNAGIWQPQWQPWPGESVVVGVTRLATVAGRTKTIDNIDLSITPGQRFSAGELTVSMRTSRGSQHTVTLPENANLQTVKVNGNPLPVRQEGQLVTVPIAPGAQTIEIQWHQATPFAPLFKTPRVNIGQEAVNARVHLKIPDNRWILFTFGPRWGPAVLFWSYLVVIVLVALVLGRIPLTELKSWHWILLALGLTQIPVGAALVVVAWLLALGIRRRAAMPEHWLGFNSFQIGLVLLTGAAIVCLFAAVKAGLLGQPQMNIAGNGSNHLGLHWTQDHISSILPQPWVLSLSVWVYRGLMLVWSLWLALSLIRWLKWGWSCFTTDALWKRIRLKRKNKPLTSTP